MTAVATNLNLPDATLNGKSRASALVAITVEQPATSILSYQSGGNLLITGPGKEVRKVYRKFESESSIACTLLATDDPTKKKNADNGTAVEVYLADELEISGYLGEFSVTVTRGEKTTNLAKTIGMEKGSFDMVLDLNPDPVIQNEIPPPGYYPVGTSYDERQKAMEEIPAMIGKFDKPKYFAYDPDICAHGRSGIIGCTNCLESCPTGAISTAGEIVEINPHLCQGQGMCATACPSGAVSYIYPPATTTIEIIQQVVQKYMDSGGQQPELLFYDIENGSPLVQKAIAFLPENLIPVQVEEIGSVGLDVCLSATAYGVNAIHVLGTKHVPRSVLYNLNAQIQIFDALMAGMGYPEGIVQLHATNKKSRLIESIASGKSADLKFEPAPFMPTGLKRTDLHFALDYLYERSGSRKKTVSLPEDAPFGEIQVDRNTCTLCMACVSVCPASALEAGGDTPRLSFIETNCVQCGICESACPEHSITRVPRYLFDLEARMATRALNEDSPVHCTVCGKPFATRAILERMKDKLKGHWLYQDPDAVARLEMCDDCRVKAMFEKEAGNVQY